MTGFTISHYTAKAIGISIFMVMLIVAFIKTTVTGEQYVYNFTWFAFSLAAMFFLASASYLNPVYHAKSSSKPDISENQVFSGSADYTDIEAEDCEEKKINPREPESNKKT